MIHSPPALFISFFFFKRRHQLAPTSPTDVLVQDQSTVAQRAETTVKECSLRSSGGRIFFIRVNFLIRCSFHPVLPLWHVKDPGHSAKSAGGRLHRNTHTTMTQRSRSGLTMLSRHSVGTYHRGNITNIYI